MAAVPGLGAVTGTIFHGLQIKTGPRADFTTTPTTPTTPQGGCCFLPVSSEKHFEKTPDALSQGSDFRYFVYSRVLLEWIQPLIYCSNNTASGRTGSENPEWVFKKWTVVNVDLRSLENNTIEQMRTNVSVTERQFSDQLRFVVHLVFVESAERSYITPHMKLDLPRLLEDPQPRQIKGLTDTGACCQQLGPDGAPGTLCFCTFGFSLHWRHRSSNAVSEKLTTPHPTPAPHPPGQMSRKH